jgi:hypothetical protein
LVIDRRLSMRLSAVVIALIVALSLISGLGATMTVTPAAAGCCGGTEGSEG